MVSEIITLEGHILDSRSLAAVLDDITAAGAEFTIQEVHIGVRAGERSLAQIEIRAASLPALQALLARLSRHGALWHTAENCDVQIADMDGAFPEAFCATTNQQTFVRWGGEWIEVPNPEMDCGLLHDPASNTFRCVPMTQVRKGDRIVCGARGVKVVPPQVPRPRGVFEFMNSDISTEKPKNAIIRSIAQRIRACRDAGDRVLLVGGPAIVHTGAGEHLVWMIERGLVQLLFAGNALAAHDIEQHLYGTSLGVYLERATLADAGHEHHLRAINTIRRAGGIAAAIDQGVLQAGIMHACVRHGVEVVLAGSIRDDGPLPEVITDALEAQQRMRSSLEGVGFVLMIATTLHSIAVGNLLPARIPCACVDISAANLTKLSDRGSGHTIGLVTDVEPFFRELVHELARLSS